MSSLSLIPPNVIGYRVVTSDSTEGLEAAIVEQLKQGYIPYEGLIIHKPGTTSRCTFMQVMVKQGIPNVDLLKSIAASAARQTSEAPQSNVAMLETHLRAIISQLTPKASI